MQDFMEIGPIMIPIHWVYWGLSSIAGYVMIVWRLQGASLHKKKLIDTIMNGFIIAFISWKFSYLLLHPVYAFSNPISILYFDGGAKGVVIGLFTATFYVAYQSFKQNISYGIYLELIFVGLLGWSVIYHFLHMWSDLTYNILQVMVGLSLLTYLYKYKIGQYKIISTFIIIFCMIQILFQYFTNSVSFLFHLTLWQFIYLLVILIILFVPSKGGKFHR